MTPLAVALKSLLKTKVVRKSALSAEFLRPQLASLSEDIPVGKDWLFETKFDGYRILIVKEKGKIRLITRNGKDWTHRFADVALAAARIKAESFVIDGEVVVMGRTGLSSFAALQKNLSEESNEGFTYFAFDLIYLNGVDLRPLLLRGRKTLLEHLVDGGAEAKKSVLRFSTPGKGTGKTIYAKARRRRLEGIIAKNALAPYEAKRSASWLKIKCSQEDEFVIGGYTEPGGSRKHFGALLVGVFDENGNFTHVGKVGTGFDEKLLASLIAKLKPLESPKNPFRGTLTRLQARGAHYVRPKLVAQLSYTEWTSDGKLRHPVFLGLREDKPARAVRKPESISARD